MIINRPVLGPLLGYTTHNHARIWLRGSLENSSNGIRRAFSIVQVREAKSNTWSKPVVQKLEPHFDMTGVSVLENLKPETRYFYRAGWFFSDAEWDTVSSSLDQGWTDFQEIEFTTGSSDSLKPRSYVAGSCRYLLRLFGNAFFDKRGDKIFRAILDQFCPANGAGGMPTHGIIMAGDQVYADDLNFLAPDRAIDQFLERYRAVFAQPWMRQLTGRVPTYMVLDDHEIEDNWPAKASNKDWLTLYPAAIHSYQIYQASHSPLFEVKKGFIEGTPTHFWYSWTDGCVDTFVTDCRNERQIGTGGKLRQMIGDAQMNALLRWLADGSGRVKLIVTSVPFFPDLQSENEDKWGGCPPQRAQILNFILKKKIRKVVILSGDVHCSFSAELTTPADPSFKVISVVASSFFWPYPHMRDEAFDLKGTLAGTGPVAYQVRNASKVHSEDNFGRINFTPTGLEVAFYDRKGKRLGNPVSRAF